MILNTINDVPVLALEENQDFTEHRLLTSGIHSSMVNLTP